MRGKHADRAVHRPTATTIPGFQVAVLNCAGVTLTNVRQCMPAADGKPIDPKSVSVQSGKTYEQEFSLQMEKAKVRSDSGSALLPTTVPCMSFCTAC